MTSYHVLNTIFSSLIVKEAIVQENSQRLKEIISLWYLNMQTILEDEVSS